MLLSCHSVLYRNVTYDSQLKRPATACFIELRLILPYWKSLCEGHTRLFVTKSPGNCFVILSLKWARGDR